jgi:hypothetical protein
MKRTRMTKEGTLSIPEFVEDKKTGHFYGTVLTAADGQQLPNPEAIRVLRRDSKLRRFLEAWAAEQIK